METSCERACGHEPGAPDGPHLQRGTGSGDRPQHLEPVKHKHQQQHAHPKHAPTPEQLRIRQLPLQRLQRLPLQQLRRLPLQRPAVLPRGHLRGCRLYGALHPMWAENSHRFRILLTTRAGPASVPPDHKTNREMQFGKICVTRHPALVELLRELELIDDKIKIVSHATIEDVRGKHVFGVLPLRLASAAHCITEVPLTIPSHLRGKELSLDELRSCMREPVTYYVWCRVGRSVYS